MWKHKKWQCINGPWKIHKKRERQGEEQESKQVKGPKQCRVLSLPQEGPPQEGVLQMEERKWERQERGELERREEDIQCEDRGSEHTQ